MEWLADRGVVGRGGALQEVATGADRADGEGQRAQAAPEAQHVHVEGVAAG